MKEVASIARYLRHLAEPTEPPPPDPPRGPPYFMTVRRVPDEPPGDGSHPFDGSDA